MKKTLVAVEDMIGNPVCENDLVLVRMPFPKTSKMIYGFVEKIKADKNGRLFVKIKKHKELFSCFYKLATK